ncbi:MAG: hypothetical protein J6A73_00430 [Lachnospiraceae bacterium]|nr:hypothetical protein [Lachnospiraceae bacterium]
MNDLVKYKEQADYEIINHINYEIINAVDYEKLQAQLEKEREYIELEEKNRVSNTCSIISLILGILSSVTMLLAYCNLYVFIGIAFYVVIEVLAGIVLSVVALKRGENKVIAILGIVGAMLAILLGVILLLLYIMLFTLAAEANK